MRSSARCSRCSRTLSELDNTIVIVTSDNGLPFPRGKGQICEDACHLPLAIRWPGVAKAGLVVDDIARSTDFAPPSSKLRASRRSLK